jgi:hypothetical protein
MESNKIDISKYIKQLEDSKDPANNVVLVSLSLADELKYILSYREKLSVKDNQFPILEVSTDNKAASTEILVWAMAILSSAWTQWCFIAKNNNPNYRNDPSHPEASENVKIVHPYVKTSIIDSIEIGKEIGCRNTGNVNTAYRPESGPAYIELRKEDCS